MGLSLKDIEAGVVSVGNVAKTAVTKFNEIRQASAGVIPSPTTQPVNVSKAATAGTVGEVQREQASAGGGGLLIVGGILLLLVLAAKKGR
jgi:hypothetical protein